MKGPANNAPYVRNIATVSKVPCIKPTVSPKRTYDSAAIKAPKNSDRKANTQRLSATVNNGDNKDATKNADPAGTTMSGNRIPAKAPSGIDVANATSANQIPPVDLGHRTQIVGRCTLSSSISSCVTDVVIASAFLFDSATLKRLPCNTKTHSSPIEKRLSPGKEPSLCYAARRSRYR